jgi:hypothetical protein
VSRFTSHLGLRLLEYSNGRALVSSGMVLWAHTEPLAWEVGAVGSGEFITVPAFYAEGLTDAQLWLLETRRAVAPGVTDLASIPPAFRWLLAPNGPFTKAACLHDYLYKTRGMWGRYGREACDRIFLEAMLATGVTDEQARIIHRAVRIGGGRAFGT